MSGYGLHSEFDIEKHRETFVHYLEVVIDVDGKVMYAVPSHQEKAIRIACQKLGVTREELKHMCPREYWFDFMKWLCKISGVIAVWECNCEYWEPTKLQIATIRRLKMAGLYKGPVPVTPENDCSEYSNVQFLEKY